MRARSPRQSCPQQACCPQSPVGWVFRRLRSITIVGMEASQLISRGQPLMSSPSQRSHAAIESAAHDHRAGYRSSTQHAHEFGPPPTCGRYSSGKPEGSPGPDGQQRRCALRRNGIHLIDQCRRFVFRCHRSSSDECGQPGDRPQRRGDYRNGQVTEYGDRARSDAVSQLTHEAQSLAQRAGQLGRLAPAGVVAGRSIARSESWGCRVGTSGRKSWARPGGL